MKRENRQLLLIFILFALVFKDIGSASEGLSEIKDLEMPVDVVVGKNDWIYVADSLKAKILVFDKNGKFLFDFGGKWIGRDTFTLPWSVDFDQDRYIYVTDIAEHKVSIWTIRGNLRGQFGGMGSGQGRFNMPFDLNFGKGGKVFVLDTGNNQIQIIVGNFLKQFGREGLGNGEFRNPSAFAVTDKGKIYVVDTGNNRVQVFNTRGDYIQKFGKPGGDLGEFSQPQGIAIDSMNRIFISDTGNNRIECFNENGESVFAFGKKGNRFGEFNEPGKIYIDKEDRLFVVDSKNNRVQIFSDVIYKFGPCEMCHKRNMDKAVSVHSVYKEGCGKCHLPHGKISGLKLIKDLKELCQDCHNVDNAMHLGHKNFPIEKIPCTDCHDPHLSKNKKLLRGHKPVVLGRCESCHSMKKDGIQFVDEKGMLCYACHTTRINKRHSNLRKDNACSLCHKAHGSSYEGILNKDLKEICLNEKCHNNLNTENHSHPFKMFPSAKVKVSSELKRAKDGEIICVTCHSSHISENKAMLLSSKGELCIKCHGGFN